MILRKSAGVFLALAFFQTACSTYQGPKPDFNLTGEARQTEIQKFRFTEGFFHQGAAHFEMGGRHYWLSSLTPLVSDVSPEAMKQIERAKFWRSAAWLMVGAAAVILVSELSDGDDEFSRDQSIGYWSFLGLGVGAGFTRSYWMDRAAGQYNRDLESRFAPAVSFNFGFQ